MSADLRSSSAVERIVVSELRDGAEQRQAERSLDVGRIGDRLVDLLERERERRADDDAGEQRRAAG